MTILSKQNKKSIHNTQKRINKTIFEKKLIENDDKIVVGLSGGKDSFVLLDALFASKKAMNLNFEITAVHIKVKNVPYKVDWEFMEKYCSEKNINFQNIETEVDFSKDTKMSKCFICSWHRRTELFKFTTRNGFNKLALGHHLDDAIETLLLNMAFNGEISSMPFKVGMLNNKFEIIRPLLETEEKFLIEYAEIMNFNREIQKCPFAEQSKREKFRKHIEEISKINPDARKNLFRSMKKIVPKFLPE